MKIDECTHGPGCELCSPPRREDHDEIVTEAQALSAMALAAASSNDPKDRLAILVEVLKSGTALLERLRK